MLWNYELEQATLSCLLVDPECIGNIELISVEDFADETNKKIFNAVSQLLSQKKNIDYLTVFEELQSKIELNHLLNIGQYMPTSSNFETYVDQLTELTRRRKLYYLADKIKAAAFNGDDDVFDMAEQGIFALRDTEQKQENITQIVTEAMEQIEKRIEEPGILGLTSGFKDIDALTDGFKPTDYLVIGGRPSMGKSALAYNIAQRCGGKVDIYSLETSQHAVYKRMIMAEANVSALKIRSGKFSQAEKDAMLNKLWDAARTLYGGRLRVIDGMQSVAQIKTQSRKRKAREGLDLIVIDYLQLVKSPGKERFSQVTNISMAIREMIMELRVPVLALAQLNRVAGEKKIPEIRELRESGQIEQDADCIMLLHREDYYDITSNQTPANEGEADLIFAKQRDNPVGSIKLGFIKNCTKFIDFDELYKNFEGGPW